MIKSDGRIHATRCPQQGKVRLAHPTLAYERAGHGLPTPMCSWSDRGRYWVNTPTL
jgi:hypothetical protein